MITRYLARGLLLVLTAACGGATGGAASADAALDGGADPDGASATFDAPRRDGASFPDAHDDVRVTDAAGLDVPEVVRTPDASVKDAAPRPDAARSPDATPGCGNGTIDPGESCDDGNAIEWDACDRRCVSRTGDDMLLDYDVASDGGLFVATSSIGTLALTGWCFGTDGGLLGTVRIDPPSRPNAAHVAQVFTANAAGTSLVLWASDTPATEPRLIGRVFDAGCNPVTDAIGFPQAFGGSGEYVDAGGYYVAMQDDGRFVLAWRQAVGGSTSAVRAYLRFFDPVGVPIGADLLVDEGANCAQSPVRVAVDPATGQGVVACRNLEGAPIGFRRFGAGRTWLDPAFVQVAASDGMLLDWRSHFVMGMSRSGAFVIEWYDKASSSFEASFHAASGAVTKHVVLGGAMEPIATTDPILVGLHEEAARFGDDFLLHSGYEGLGWQNHVWRASPDGTVIGCDLTPHWAFYTRTGDSTSAWLVPNRGPYGWYLAKDALGLTTVDGCAGL